MDKLKSRVFSSDSLAAGAAAVRQQCVKTEGNTSDGEDMQRELQDHQQPKVYVVG